MTLAYVVLLVVAIVLLHENDYPQPPVWRKRGHK
jgi:hypothetical protein